MAVVGRLPWGCTPGAAVSVGSLAAVAPLSPSIWRPASTRFPRRRPPFAVLDSP